ncbi:MULTISPECIES: restriction endonuclease subunit S [Paraburkholderia]|uniref:restriction endonuclease subunit S n=1 Tax=Paraburkholderia TaxID=1822464 RepID=UPI0022528636|nr:MULTISPECIES: restriction endonuclease subunit S [Paraburkholderia]MCX4156303.1 restriction endonuclease subunit S [Paraburkholderia aspalathi]MDN7165708.1 restriction endonuclease subunit S [Paraburkholderia sp. SECH2]MDQ6394194.1 restriction endonuclease subunit S [Paraburkholderia aspalathi]
MRFDKNVVGLPAAYPRGFSTRTAWKWPLVPARQLIELHYGKALRADVRVAGAVPVYGTNGQCGWHDTPLAKGPGLILGRKGQGPLGVEWCDADYWVIDTAYYGSTLTPDVRLKYLYHLIKYIGLNHLKDGTSNPTLSRAAFGQQLFPLPNVAEQDAIVSILGALDARIDLLRLTNITLESIARVLFKSWFVDFDPVRAKQEGRSPEGMDEAAAARFPSGFEESELGLVPMGWRVGSLKEMCNIASGKRPSDRGDTLSQSCSVRLYGGAGIMGYTSASLFNGPRILTGRVGTLGKIHVAYPPFWASDNVLVLEPNDDVLFWFVLHRLRLIDVLSLNRGSTQPLLTQKDLGAQLGVIPSEAVLRKFSQMVSPLYEQIRMQDMRIETLMNLRDTLLPRLISGQLRLPEAEALVA